jgi:ATP-dependent exoDNAse (exonuclease V) beta subunit
MDGDNIIINDYKTNTKISPDTKDKVKEQIDLYGFAIKQQYASKVKKVF